MAKGADSERETCKELGQWWAGRSDVFWRTAGSGGRATMRAKRKKKTAYEYGDITFTDPIGKPLIDFFLLENKSGYKDDISIVDFIDSAKKEPTLLKWWRKAELEKRLAGRYYSVIIFRRTRRRKCIFLPYDLFNALESWCGEYKRDIVDLHYGADSWTIVKFNHFLEWVTPETIRAMLEDKESKPKLKRRRI
ncbi:MAG: hypothetical protein AM326_01735 [Candidatus Thorarchaeota archaeon SMTZ-45]|nr:MAG: hypothetical protein AM326_01735 [Candidatus Thorarchaeota archaeon SMTZ-45]